MTRHLASANRFPLGRPFPWAAMLVLAFSSYTPAAGENLDEPHPLCHDTIVAVNGIDFEPIVHEISTTTLLGSDSAEVRWALSSEVTSSVDSASDGVRYCYAYLFKNEGDTPVRISLVSPRLAMSPLFEIMQDFSLVLYPGASESIRFSTISAPKLVLATAYNSARDEKVAKWAFVSSGPISLYLPAVVQASYSLSE